MSERRAGWYWVREADHWEAAWWHPDVGWQLLSGDLDDRDLGEVGPRIPAPDET